MSVGISQREEDYHTQDAASGSEDDEGSDDDEEEEDEIYHQVKALREHAIVLQQQGTNEHISNAVLSTQLMLYLLCHQEGCNR